MKYNEINVYVPISLYQDPEVYDFDISVYAFCKALGMINPAHIVISTLTFHMFADDWSIDKKVKIKESLMHLIDLGYLNGTRITKGEYVIQDLDKKTTEKFAIVNIEDIQRIIRSSYKKRYAMVRYWCYLMQSRNSNLLFDWHTNFLSHQKISYFQHVCNKSKSTIIRYNDALEKLGILYIVHTHSKKSDEHNYYSRAKDKEIVDNYLKTKYNDIN